MKEQIRKVTIKTIKTMAQTAVGVIGGATLLGDVNWLMVGSASMLAGVVCVLMNIADLKEE